MFVAEIEKNPENDPFENDKFPARSTVVKSRWDYASHNQDRRQAHRCLHCTGMQGELLLGFRKRFDDSEPVVQPFRVPILTVADCVVEVHPSGS
jgi:hypothetical protein